MTLQADASSSPVSAPAQTVSSPVPVRTSDGPVQFVLWTMCLLHFINDMLQSLISSILPILKDSYQFNFTQVSLIAAVFMASASLLQPLVGLYTDKRTSPWMLSLSMVTTGTGIFLLSFAGTYAALLVAAVLIGLGSAIFHPEGSRMARLGGGNRLGLAQSTFQVGGNFGQASGPLVAAFVIVPLGQGGTGWFALVAVLAFAIMLAVGRWAAPRMRASKTAARGAASMDNPFGITRNRAIFIIGVLMLLTFSKSFYSASISTFYIFYLMEKFAVSLRDAQLYLFLFMGSVAAGVYFGGPLGDRIGRKYVIWISIFGALPFTLMLPYADLFWCAVLTVIIGFIMSASMSQILVYAMELAPGKVGLVAGLFFGFGFGMAGLGAAVLGFVADKTSLGFVFKICSFLPAIGLATIFLPDLRARNTG